MASYSLAILCVVCVCDFPLPVSSLGHSAEVASIRAGTGPVIERMPFTGRTRLDVTVGGPRRLRDVASGMESSGTTGADLVSCACVSYLHLQPR